MAPTIIDLEPFRFEITTKIKAGVSHSKILEDLKSRHGLDCAYATLKRRLKTWNVRVLPEKKSADLIDAIQTQATSSCNDKELANHLRSQGFTTVTAKQIKNIRHEQRIVYRYKTEDDAEAAYKITRDAVFKAVLEDGHGRSYGRVLMRAHLWNYMQIRARQPHVQRALQELNKQLGLDKRPGMKQARVHTNYGGPNRIWSIDGHDKLFNYGFEIYACIDAHSRKLIWTYIGLSNRTQISIAKQYLVTVQNLGKMPEYIRSDRGKETAMLADTQLTLYTQVCKDQGTPAEVADNVEISTCYIYGTSVHNIAIESNWNRMIRSQTRPWMDQFKYFADHGFFDGDLISDRVITLFVFMPILREELKMWTLNHNSHTIRKQVNAGRLTRGIPDSIYVNDTQQYGYSPNQALIQELLQPLEEYDLNAYLTESSLQWCAQKLRDVGKLDKIRSPEFIQIAPELQYLIPRWYRALIQAGREYTNTGGRLELAPKPHGGYDWMPKHESVRTALEGHQQQDQSYPRLQDIQTLQQEQPPQQEQPLQLAGGEYLGNFDEELDFSLSDIEP